MAWSGMESRPPILFHLDEVLFFMFNSKLMAEDITKTAKARGLPLHKALKEMNVYTIFHYHLEDGREPKAGTLEKVLAWLGTDFERYICDEATEHMWEATINQFPLTVQGQTLADVVAETKKAIHKIPTDVVQTIRKKQSGEG